MARSPDYQRDGVTLYLGNCLGILPEISAVDAVVTDPPYGIGINKSHRLSTSRGHGGETWDDKPCDPLVLWWIMARAVPAIIWGGNYFDLPPARCVLVWDKNNEGRDFADFEMAWTNLDMVARIHRQRPMNMDGGKQHPTQKPEALMQWCLSHLPPTASVIVDPFMGSGSTGVACIHEGKNFIGIEQEPKYFDIACKRIDKAMDEDRDSLWTAKELAKDIQKPLFTE